MELTILMPCLNEAKTLAACIRQAKEFLTRENISGEILISDNGSSDGSQNIALSCGARVVHSSLRGYGAALMNGIREARGQFIIMGDADGSYDFSNLMPFVNPLRNGCELVMGNRFKGGIQYGAMPFLNRYLGNPVLSFLGRLFFKTQIGDFHCGLRGFNTKSIQNIKLQAPGMEFASEMIVKASLNKLRMTEVPTTLSPDGRNRPPHLNKWQDGWRHLKLLLLLSPRWMFLYPGMFLASLGILLMTLLAFGPIYLGDHRIDIHTMLFASSFFVVGIQAIFFSLFGNVIANSYLKLDWDKKLETFLKKFTLERGILIGGLFVFAGMGLSAVSFGIWANTQFGDLVPNEIMRLVIPAVTCLIVGMQIIFSSFFMGMIINFGLDKA